MGLCWRWPALLPAARLSASPGCLQAWCAPVPAGAARPSPARPGSRAGAQPAARLRRERRAGCVNPAPRSFPHSRQPMSGRAPPRAPPPPRPRPGNRQSRVGSRPTSPPATKGGRGTRPRTSGTGRENRRASGAPGCPGRGTPGLGGIAGFTCRPSRPAAGWRAESSVGGAGNLKGKSARGTESGAPEVGEPRPTRLLPPPPCAVPARAQGRCPAAEPDLPRAQPPGTRAACSTCARAVTQWTWTARHWAGEESAGQVTKQGGVTPR